MAGTLIVDVDYVCFLVASASELKSIKAVYGEHEYHAKHKTEFKSMELAEGLTHDLFEIKDNRSLKPNALANAKTIMRRCIESYKRLANCDEVIAVIGNGKTFRDDLPLPVKYKGNRDGLIRPLILKDCREFITTMYPCEKAIRN